MNEDEVGRAAEGVGPYNGAGMCPHEIGDKIRFKPSAFHRTKEEPLFEIQVEVTGTVIQIHEEHRWYRVEYTMPGCIGRETFKF